MYVIILAITFSMTIGRQGDHVQLRYPDAPDVTWTEVCVWTQGEAQDGRDPDVYHEWETTSCWTPRFRLEEMRLAPGTLKAKATLTIDEGGRRNTLTTPVVQERPEREETHE